MLYKEVIFDLVAKKIAFVPEECPEHKARPKVPTLDHPSVDAVEVPPASSTTTSFGTTGTQIASTTTASGARGTAPTTTSTMVKPSSKLVVTHQNAASSSTKSSATQRTVTKTTVSTTPSATHSTATMQSSSTKSVGTHRTVARASTVAASTTSAPATSRATASSTSSSEGNASFIQRDSEDSTEDEMPADAQWWRQGPQLSAAQIIIPVLVLMFVTAVSATACVVKPKPVTLSSVEDPESADDTVGLQSKPPV
mmetsp:Transcript_52195/g.96603  ORF Transcript_52195/g.96603 Transcript_52195/m.96603 type:complete len:254 (-) Transcript_52195:172-933(-)